MIKLLKFKKKPRNSSFIKKVLKMSFDDSIVGESCLQLRSYTDQKWGGQKVSVLLKNNRQISLGDYYFEELQCCEYKELDEEWQSIYENYVTEEFIPLIGTVIARSRNNAYLIKFTNSTLEKWISHSLLPLNENRIFQVEKTYSFNIPLWFYKKYFKKIIN